MKKEIFCANCCTQLIQDELSFLFSACLPQIPSTLPIPIPSGNDSKESASGSCGNEKADDDQEKDSPSKLPVEYLERITYELESESLQPSFVLVNHDDIKSEPLTSISTTETTPVEPNNDDKIDMEATITTTVLDALFEIYHFQWKSRMDLKRLAERNKNKLRLCVECAANLSKLFHCFTSFKSNNKNAYLYPIVGDTEHFISLKNSNYYDEDKENLILASSKADLKECFVPIIKSEVKGCERNRRKRKPSRKIKLEKMSDTEYETDSAIRSKENQKLPFKCNNCRKGFTSTRGLSMHKKIHTQQEVISSCPTCQQVFSNKFEFKKHMKSCIKNDSEDNEEILPDLATSNSEFEGEGDSTDFTNKTEPSDTDIIPTDDDDVKPRIRKRRSRTARNLLSSKIEIEQNTGPIDCTICGKVFKNRTLFRSHRRVHAIVNNCDYCPEEFSDKASLRRHLNLAHESEKAYLCPTCNKSFFTLLQLKKHSVNHEEKTNFNCPICVRPFENETMLKAHQLTHSTEEKVPQYKCTICGKKYPSYHLLNSHIKYIHEKRNDFQCPDCGKSFGTVSYLNAHLVSHSTTGTHLCEICGKNYKHKKDLRIHEFRFHSVGVNRNPHQCPVCSKSYYRADHLRIHQVKKNHFASGEPPEIPEPAQDITPDENFLASQPFRCELCGKEYVSELALKTHEVTHSELPEAPKHSCEECGRKYLNLKALDYHVKYMHKLKGSHACDKCDKTFGRYSSLKRHELTHNDRATHACDDCDRTYKNKLDLILHYKREHLGESSFDHECQVCEKRFYRKDMLRIHQVRSGHLQLQTQYITLITTDADSSEVPAQDAIEIETQVLGQEDIEETQEVVLNAEEIIHDQEQDQDQPLDTSDLQVFMVAEMEM